MAMVARTIIGIFAAFIIAALTTAHWIARRASAGEKRETDTGTGLETRTPLDVMLTAEVDDAKS